MAHALKHTNPAGIVCEIYALGVLCGNTAILGNEKNVDSEHRVPCNFIPAAACFPIFLFVDFPEPYPPCRVIQHPTEIELWVTHSTLGLYFWV